MGHFLHLPRGSFEKRLKKSLARWGVIVQIVDVDRAKPAGRWPVLRTNRYPLTLIDEEWDCAAEASRRCLVRVAGYPSPANAASGQKPRERGRGAFSHFDLRRIGLRDPSGRVLGLCLWEAISRSWELADGISGVTGWQNWERLSVRGRGESSAETIEPGHRGGQQHRQNFSLKFDLTQIEAVPQHVKQRSLRPLL